MRIPRVIFATTVLASSAALAIAAPAQAAELTPSGSALIRIDGERAIAKKASDDRYFIVMPAGAEASWIGPAAGVEGIASGRFGARTLVSSWAGLGHRGADRSHDRPGLAPGDGAGGHLRG